MESKQQISMEERRNRRRQKILNNMDDRLKKISDLPGGSDTDVPPTITKVEEISLQEDISSNVDNIAPLIEEHVQFDLPIETKSADEFVQEEVPERLFKERTPIPTSAKPVTRNKWLGIIESKQIHVVLLAIAVMIMMQVDFGYLFNENVLLPLATLELASMFVRPVQGTLGFVQLLVPNQFRPLISIASLIASIGSDLTLYLFTIVLISKLTEVSFEEEIIVN